jgi:predicted dehydrogenase
MFDMLRKNGPKADRTVRFAVVGLGWIAQEAVLPAFANAENAELTALVSDDPVKLAELSQRYSVNRTYSYDEYELCLNNADVDAVFICLPNNLHHEYTVRAAEAGVHVLCEKPLAMNAGEAREMIEACNRGGVQLMTAYRLHFEEANLMAVEICNSGALGDLRLFTALNMQNVESGNIRLSSELTGGPLEDLGIYCINAARYIFQSEPLEVTAFAESSDNPRFREVPELVSVLMRFPENRLAQFTCGFGESKASTFHVFGTLGNLKLDPAFSFQGDLKHVLTLRDERPEEKTYRKRDQFAPQIVHFSNCILNDEPVEPSGIEGLTDLVIVDAMRESILTSRSVRLNLPQRDYRPTIEQELQRKAVRKQDLIHADHPGADGK